MHNTFFHLLVEYSYKRDVINTIKYSYYFVCQLLIVYNYSLPDVLCRVFQIGKKKSVAKMAFVFLNQQAKLNVHFAGIINLKNWYLCFQK